MHEIYTFCFAKGRLPGDFLGGTPAMSNQGSFPIPMIYSALRPVSPARGQPGLVMVDTGFRLGRSMTGRNFDDYETPAETLAKIGHRPEEVELVVLTHLHFDHAGNLAAFPNARFLVQRREYTEWRRVLDRHRGDDTGKDNWALSSINPADFEVIEVLRAEGRIALMDGDAEIMPGISCRLAADTHTFGSQWLRVDTADGPRILAGDCAYWYRNIERMWPPGYLQGTPWRILETFETMLAEVAGEVNRIVVGHDMEIFTRHASFEHGRNPVAEVHRPLPRG